MALFRHAVFEISVAEPSGLPAPYGKEIAFAGRSNSGKSSAINTLAGHTRLAYVSKTPGRTQLINLFRLKGGAGMVDLPGYGFAKASKDNKAAWDKMIRDYLEKRMNLMTVFILIDVRHEPQKVDVKFINWMGEKEISFVIVFTKSDKIGKQLVASSVAAYKRELLQTWDQLPTFFITSAEKNVGRDEILDYIENVNKEFKK